MAKMNDKLDKILHSVENLTLRIDKFEKTIFSYGERLEELEGKFNTKFEEIDIRWEDQAETSELEILQAKLATIEESIKEQERTAVMQEAYKKRLNISIHDIPEPNNSVWESPIQILGAIQNFMKDGLLISDPLTTPLADYHRLPQRPVFRDGRKVTQPIIIELTTAPDKKRIFSSLKNITDYNERRRTQNHRTKYVTNHLSKSFQEEQKLLLPQFKKARKLNQKTVWRAENGHYNLYVNDTKVELSS